jgi:hypothetical protein
MRFRLLYSGPLLGRPAIRRRLEAQHTHENYRQGRFSLVYHLHVAMVPKVNTSGVSGAEMFRSDSELNAVAVFTSNRLNPADLYLRDQEPVFVGNVEVMYGVQGIPVPSLVRLYLVEEFPAYCDDGCLFWSLPDKHFKMLFDLGGSEG